MKKYELKIEQDTDPINPREDWDNITTMVCGHRSYELGDKHNYKQGDFNSWDEMKNDVDRLFDKYIPEFPKEVELKLPTLKKIELPKLNKIENNG